MVRTVAGIDCGTHSTRLLIERDDGEAVVREVALTRLGEGLAVSGRLQPQAIERVGQALARYRVLLDAHNVDALRVVATSAVRDGANGSEFHEMVARTLGASAEVIDGTTEARLVFAGATAELGDYEGPFLVFDIGGGSTEFAFGHRSCEAAISLEIGSVRLSEQYLKSDPPRPEELSACITVTGAWLDDLDRELPQAQNAATIVGVAGTVSTAVAVEIGLPIYDRAKIHHFVLTREAAEDVYRTLATESRADRAHNPGLPAERVDAIVGGLAVLVKIMRHLGADQIIVSEADMLDGLVGGLR